MGPDIFEQQYESNVVVINAIRLTTNNIVAVKNAIPDAIWKEPDEPDLAEMVIGIPTLEGVMDARVGAWVVKGMEGEYYPVKHSVFEKKYHPFDPETSCDSVDHTLDVEIDEQETGGYIGQIINIESGATHIVNNYYGKDE